MRPLLLAVALLGCSGTGESDRSRAASDKPGATPSAAPAQQTAAPATTTGDVMRLVQAQMYRIGARKVGVMNIWAEAPGGPVVASLAIIDPETRGEEKARVHADDVIDVGTERYRVVQVVAPQGNERGWLEIALISGSAN